MKAQSTVQLSRNWFQKQLLSGKPNSLTFIYFLNKKIHINFWKSKKFDFLLEASCLKNCKINWVESDSTKVNHLLLCTYYFVRTSPREEVYCQVTLVTVLPKQCCAKMHIPAIQSISDNVLIVLLQTLLRNGRQAIHSDLLRNFTESFLAVKCSY